MAKYPLLVYLQSDALNWLKDAVEYPEKPIKPVLYVIFSHHLSYSTYYITVKANPTAGFMAPPVIPPTY